MDAYTLVSCDFHDELEAIATLRQTCRIVYRSESNITSESSGRIVDVYAADHADYVKLQDGTIIRLDRIVPQCCRWLRPLPGSAWLRALNRQSLSVRSSTHSSANF